MPLLLLDLMTVFTSSTPLYEHCLAALLCPRSQLDLDEAGRLGRRLGWAELGLDSCSGLGTARG